MPEPMSTRWVYPLPRIEGHKPVVRGALCGAHPYADLSYDGDPSLRFVPVLAACDGVISYAGKRVITCAGRTRISYSLCVDHADGWSTRYGDLEYMLSPSVDRYAKRRKQRVRAGDVLGYASHDPIHLSFELWRRNADGCGPADPAEHMRTWSVIPWLAWTAAPIAGNEHTQPSAA